jgi:hypothetical protein
MQYEIDHGTIRQLQVLQRQYFQLVDPQSLRWPDDGALKASDAQSWMYNKMFDVENIKSLPPGRYRLRVLKLLIHKLEGAIDDPEEDVRPPVSLRRRPTFCILDCVHIAT